jgi:hypothetical protein
MIENINFVNSFTKEIIIKNYRNKSENGLTLWDDGAMI